MAENRVHQHFKQLQEQQEPQQQQKQQEEIIKKIGCEICGSFDGLLRCARCRSVLYCSQKHQRDDWPKHKIKCKLFKLNPSIGSGGSSSSNISVNASGPNRSLQTQNNNIDHQFLVHSQQQNQLDPFSIDRNHVRHQSHTNSHKQLQQHQQIIYQQTTNWSPSSNNHLNEENNFNPSEIIEKERLLLPTNTNGDFNQDNSLGVRNSDQIEIEYDDKQQKPHLSLQNSMEISAMDQDNPNLYSQSEVRHIELCKQIINDMNEYGLSVIDDFLGRAVGLEILKEVHRLYAQNLFQNGQVVSNGFGDRDPTTIRGDKIHWVSGTEDGCSNIGFLINQIDNVVSSANKMRNNGEMGIYTLKERTKAMIACYPGLGSQYVMHVDNPNKDGRVITAIYYLNINWDVLRSGGLLRIIPEYGSAVADIEPKFDRIIFFWSDRRNPHEVQPSHRTRYAITVWYFDADERKAAMSRNKNNKNVAAITPTANK